MTLPIIYILELETFVPTNDPLVFEKECIYTGTFVKRSPNEELRFSVDSGLIDHWISIFDEMKKNGVEVPVPLNHTTDPEKRRGTVERFVKKPNAKGLPALFAHVKFKDQEAAALAKTTNVSIYVEPEFTDGAGRRYVRPIRHVALTDYPVIPGLGPFQAIAASYDQEISMSTVAPPAAPPPIVSLRSIATKLGIGPEIPDAQLLAAIDAKITAMAKPAAPPAAPPRPIAASFVKMLKDNRTLRMNALVEACKMTPAVKAHLESAYLTDDALTLALSSDDVESEFDRVLKTIELNGPVMTVGSKTGSQSSVALSHGQGEPEQSILVRNAEKRAAAAK